MGIAMFLGRFAPPHKGHIETLMDLFRLHNKVIIGLGSCYESGTSRHPLLAIFREKMIRASLTYEKVDPSRYEFVYLQDFYSFEPWWDHVLTIAQRKGVTHFVSGNKEEVLDILQRNYMSLPFEFVDPEPTSKHKFHSSDLRKAIAQGNDLAFMRMAATGTVQLMGSVDGFNGIRQAIDNCGLHFVPGRQAVDVVFLITDTSLEPHERYLLCGIRYMSKKNFPGHLGLPGGGIDEYESPIDAALRELKEKTGIRARLINNSIEPAHIIIQADDRQIMTELRCLGLFSSDDPILVGLNGGSSQVFMIHIAGGHPRMFLSLRSDSDLDSVGFRQLAQVHDMAYMQGEMVRLALNQLR